MTISFKGAHFPQDIILLEQCQQQRQTMLGGKNRGLAWSQTDDARECSRA